jgi:ferredoxin
MEKTKVYLKRVDKQGISNFLSETFAFFKDINFLNGERVLLYFDGYYNRKKDLSTYPDENLLKEIIKKLLSFGVQLRVGVSVVEYLPENIYSILKSFPIEIVSFMREGFVKVQHKKIVIGPERKGTEHTHRRVLSKLYLPQSYFWANSLITISKIKLHPFYIFEGATVGILSLTPSYTKVESLFYGANLTILGEALSEIISIINEKIKLIFLEGFSIFEGDEIKGNIKDLNVLLSSNDILSIDSVASVLVGLRPKENPIFNSISLRNLGENKLINIEIKGDKFDTLIRKVKFPTKRKKTLFSKTSFKINSILCTDCEICTEICPTSCIDLSNHIIDLKRCIACFECYLRCPEDAIEIK